MASGGVSLQNFLLFPPFAGLPAADELDAGFYAENAQGEEDQDWVLFQFINESMTQCMSA